MMREAMNQLVTHMKEQTDRIDGDISSVNGVLSGLQEDISGLEGDISDVQTDVGNAQGDIDDAKLNVNLLLSHYDSAVFDAEVVRVGDIVKGYTGTKIAFTTDSHHRRSVNPIYGEVTITDGTYSLSHMANVCELSKYTYLDMIIHGGDVVWDYDSKPDNTTLLLDVAKEFEYNACCPARFVWGNHDSSHYQYWLRNAPRNINEILLPQEKKRITINPEDTIGQGYYYYDIESSKTRVVIVNAFEYVTSTGVPIYNISETVNGVSPQGGYSNAQLTWFYNTLRMEDKADPNLWGVVIFAHNLGNFDSYGGTYVNAGILATIIQHFLAKTSASLTLSASYDALYSGTIAVDFTDRTTTEMIGTFNGHRHYDRYSLYAGILPVTHTASSLLYDVSSAAKSALLSGYNAVVPTRTVNTATEDCFDIININRSTRTVNLTRFGAGSNRSYTY